MTAYLIPNAMKADDFMKLFFRKLFFLLSKSDKRFLGILLIFSIFVSLMETVGIAAIMPFISIASDFTIIHTNELYSVFYSYFEFASEIDFILFFGILLILFYFLRSGINLFYFYMLARFSKGRYHFLVYRLFENYLGRSYKSFTKENSSNLSKTIINEAHNLTTLISALLFMLSEVFVVVFIYMMMLYINWKITFLISFILVANAFFLMKTVSRRIKAEGSRRESYQKAFYEIINRTLGNFKMIKLKSDDTNILQSFSSASWGYTRSNIVNETIGHIPRLFLEALGFIIVIFIVLYLVYVYKTDISAAIALISMFILGLYRLMPSANRILSSYNQILFYYRSLEIVHNDLIYEIEDLGEEKISFAKELRLKNVGFSYIENKVILQDINLSISKGSKVAFIGESGSGKSTLIDLIMGIYRPKEGVVYVDGILLDDNNVKSWRKSIGYIPQMIYLFDGSVAENVAFNSEIDEDRVKKVLRQANILDFLEKDHDGINTQVGENGLNLSGGQKQRIAIARALYNDPDILVLDEATSALDNETESKIMDEICALSKSKTLIVIAHRVSTIQGFDFVYHVKKGNIQQV